METQQIVPNGTKMYRVKKEDLEVSPLGFGLIDVLSMSGPPVICCSNWNDLDGISLCVWRPENLSSSSAEGSRIPLCVRVLYATQHECVYVQNSQKERTKAGGVKQNVLHILLH